MATPANLHPLLLSSLYRRSLKLALDWTVNRYLWRGQALYLRGLFEANKHVTQPRQQKVRNTASSTHRTLQPVHMQCWRRGHG